MANLEQLNIASLLKMQREGSLILDPDFQRGDVWTKPAKVLLIDSILRGFPIPKIVLRTRLNTQTLETVMEVVDGQQRLRAIVEYTSDAWALGAKAREYSGLKYSQLEETDKERLLSYAIGIDNLMNASDDHVLEIFARMNTYTVALTPPELRHAAFNGRFQAAVLDVAESNTSRWTRWGTFTTRRLVRMADHSLIAELFGILTNGLTDAGEAQIEALYAQFDRGATEISQSEALRLAETTNTLLERIDADYSEVFAKTRLASATHFAMLFAALAHATFGLPQGALGVLPERGNLLDKDIVTARLSRLISAMELPPDEAPAELVPYVSALEQTIRMASREPRFLVMHRLLTDGDLG